MIGKDAIRVFIVDDHPIVRRGLSNLLSAYPDLEIVGEAEDASGALSGVKDLAPEIVLLDIQMSGVNGIEVASRILHKEPQIKIIILTAYDNDEYVLGAFRAGAYAYLLKNSLDETVIETIRLVHHGQRVLSPSLTSRVLGQFQVLAQDRASQQHQLSPPDVQVLKLMANGATNEEIAKQTNWSESAVKRKIEEIAATLGARNRTQAVAIAIREGLI